MGLGLQGAYGLQSLDDMLRQRMQDRLAAEAVAEKIRQFNVQSGENTRAHDLTAETARRQQDFLDKQREDILKQRADEFNTKSVEHMPAGAVDTGTVAKIQAAGYGGHIKTTPEQQAEPGAGVLRTAPGAMTPQLYKPGENQFAGGPTWQNNRTAAQESLARLTQAENEKNQRQQTQQDFTAGQNELYKLTAAQQETLRRMQQDQSAAPELSGNALDMTAKMYAKTGQLPPMGMGKAAASLRAKVLDRASQYNPDTDSFGGAASVPDIASASSTFGAGKASERQLTQNVNAVSAFAQTADKNAALLKEAIASIPDTGLPLLNQPLRALATKTGDPNMARFNAIRQSVANEYSRLISQPNLTGVLSDTARREAEAVLSGDATPRQMLQALETLKAEGENRRQAYTAQLQSIRQGIRGGPAPTPTEAPKRKSGADWLKENGL